MKERKQTFIVDNEISLLDAIFNFKKDMSKKSIKSYIRNKMVRVNGNVITNNN